MRCTGGGGVEVEEVGKDLNKKKTLLFAFQCFSTFSLICFSFFLCLRFSCSYLRHEAEMELSRAQERGRQEENSEGPKEEKKRFEEIARAIALRSSFFFSDLYDDAAAGSKPPFAAVDVCTTTKTKQKTRRKMLRQNALASQARPRAVSLPRSSTRGRPHHVVCAAETPQRRSRSPQDKLRKPSSSSANAAAATTSPPSVAAVPPSSAAAGDDDDGGAAALPAAYTVRFCVVCGHVDANRGVSECALETEKGENRKRWGETKREKKKNSWLSRPRENESRTFSLFLSSDTEFEPLGACSVLDACLLIKKNERRSGEAVERAGIPIRLRAATSFFFPSLARSLTLETPLSPPLVFLSLFLLLSRSPPLQKSSLAHHRRPRPARARDQEPAARERADQGGPPRRPGREREDRRRGRCCCFGVGVGVGFGGDLDLVALAALLLASHPLGRRGLGLGALALHRGREGRRGRRRAVVGPRRRAAERRQARHGLVRDL